MTTRLDPRGTAALPSTLDGAAVGNEDFHTGLIARFAKEFFASGREAPQPTTPSSSVSDTAFLPSAVFPSAVFPGAVLPASPDPTGFAVPVIHARPVPHPTRAPVVPDGSDAARGRAAEPALEAYAFGEPRSGAALSQPPVGISPIAIHHAKLDSSDDYYYLGQNEGAARPSEPARAPARPESLPTERAPSNQRAPSHRSEHPPIYAEALPDRVPSQGQAAGPILSAFDVQAIRRDFPALHQTVNGKPLVWLDNAATTQKPQSVIDITSEYYSKHNSNIHRAAHTLAARSTDLFESARDKLRDFVGAAHSKEIVFLRGTTEAINLVANSFGQQSIREGDEILITHIEHHANIVPWQLLAQRTGAVLKVAPVDDDGALIIERFAALLGPRTKLVSVTQVANALGTIVPVEQIIALSHARGVPVLVDAAQSAPHLPIDVQALDADFLVLSGHKIFGPTGIGILYGKAHHLERMPPWQGGGHMIRKVTFEETTYQGLPEKFEAGTPDIAGAIGLGAAVDYLGKVGLPSIAAYEHALLDYATEGLSQVRGLKLIGTAPEKASVLSFVVAGFEPEQVSRHLDKLGIATRSGHHCAQPALRRFGVDHTVRASLAFYNTKEDVDALLNGLNILPKR